VVAGGCGSLVVIDLILELGDKYRRLQWRATAIGFNFLALILHGRGKNYGGTGGNSRNFCKVPIFKEKYIKHY